MSRSVRVILGARPVLTVGVLVAGGIAGMVGRPAVQWWIWMAGLVALGGVTVARTIRGMAQGTFAADVVASMAIATAAVLGEPAAGLVIVLMQTGGEALERAAARRATRAVAMLEAQAPRIGHRLVGARIVDIPVADIAVGDLLLVRPSEMVPCDGVVRDGTTSVDRSRITGEPLPQTIEPGARLQSGAVVLDRPITIESTAIAAASLYHQIVDLVRTAQASKAPLQRLADRAAVWFTPLTVLACLITYAISGDPLRVLAVLVVATPCPLILAAPVAMLGGINRAARHQIIVRHGTALEQLAKCDTVVFDKTGTLTLGRPVVARVDPIPPFSETQVLTLAGAVEQRSGHHLARSLTAAAEARTDRLPDAAMVVEAAGRGVTGVVAGSRVTVGAMTLIDEWEPEAARRFETGNGAALRAYVVIDHEPAGSIVFDDRLRPTALAMVKAIDALGLRPAVLLSGDRTINARAAAAALGLSDAVGDLLPQDKVAYVARLGKQGRRVMMVGDGANDAPALAAASVGVAVAANGGGISAEAADVVLLSEDLTRVPEAVAIARRTMAIARQSIGVGLGLSAVAMVFAASGYLAPIAGAMVQEGIDVAVILNALRVLLPGAVEKRLHRELATGQ